MDNQVLEMLQTMENDARKRHAEVLERFNTIEDKMDGIAYQFEQTTSDRLSDKEYIIHKIYKIEKDIFEIKNAR